ncbi:camphor resistance protein CrcB [Sphingomonas gellani]|uniref:Fluoride-specific ion channel FluC n=1 Tax=Sphingomonas gellani TaxID=1166340 RepID=A0A1H8G0V6_9SPHN|nr:fluoride efflux transporter CrcB [Sphingomonas gellani]SEN37616.1 camphor resistance protein CrcB [Sphingomonas gellani]
MQALLYVMLGGAIGSGARHLVGRAMLGWLGTGFPFGTLTVNLVGGLLMGLLAGTLARAGGAGEAWRLFLAVGVLGGFTTFSSFSLDVVLMWQRGEASAAAIYLLASVTGAIAALAAGLWIASAATRVAA